MAFAKALDLGACEGAQARLLLYVIAENTFNDSFLCRLCQEQLAYEAGRVSDRTIRRHLASLEEARLIVRQSKRAATGNASNDVIRIVGFKRWYHANHGGPSVRRSKIQPDKLSGGSKANPTGQIVRLQPDSTCPPATGQQVSGTYKDNRTSKSVLSPPLTPTISTSGPQEGGEEKNSSLKSEAGSPIGQAAPAKSAAAIGWASGWTAEARAAVDEIRSSNHDAVADVADVFIDAVRELRGPAPGPTPAAYVRELAALRGFDRATLAALAAHQIKTRSTKLDSVPNLIAAAKRGFAAAPNSPTSAPAGVQISRKTKPAAVDAWIAYANGPVGRTDQKTRLLGRMLEQHGGWLVPSEFPPAEPATATKGPAA